MMGVDTLFGYTELYWHIIIEHQHIETDFFSNHYLSSLLSYLSICEVRLLIGYPVFKHAPDFLVSTASTASTGSKNHQLSLGELSRHTPDLAKLVVTWLNFMVTQVVYRWDFCKDHAFTEDADVLWFYLFWLSYGFMMFHSYMDFSRVKQWQIMARWTLAVSLLWWTMFRKLVAMHELQLQRWRDQLFDVPFRLGSIQHQNLQAFHYKLGMFNIWGSNHSSGIETGNTGEERPVIYRIYRGTWVFFFNSHTIESKLGQMQRWNCANWNIIRLQESRHKTQTHFAKSRLSSIHEIFSSAVALTGTNQWGAER